MLQGYHELRMTALSVGIPIISADGTQVFRGPEIKARPERGAVVDERLISRGWIDLRPSNWETWRTRVERYLEEVESLPGPDGGSCVDMDLARRSSTIRPGATAAWILKREDGGERVKR